MRIRNSNSAAATLPGRVDLAAPPVDSGSELGPGKLGGILLAVYVFLLVSRVLDVSSISNLRVPLILFIVVALAALGILVQRGIHGPLNNKASFCMLALTMCVVISFPFSEWRAMSLGRMQTTVQGLVVFVAVLQIASTADNWRRVASAFGYANFAAAVLSFYVGQSIEGRLALGNGSLADPNEFALSLAVGLPFLLYSAATAKPVKRIAVYGCVAVVLYCFARTGSRGGLIALAALLIVLFALSKANQKLMMIVAGIVCIVVAGAVLPGYLRERFVTFFSIGHEHVSGAVAERLDSDIASADQRKQLLIQSIDMTFQHPFLGVGPGLFPFIAGKERREETRMGTADLVTHNTYTQYSSETGIPGFIFWTATLFFCIQYTVKAYRSTSTIDPKLAQAARDTLAAVVALAVGSFFLSLAYGLEIPVLLGLAVSLRNVVQTRAATIKGTRNSTIPAPWAAGPIMPPPGSSPKPARSMPRGRRGRVDLSGRPRAQRID